MTRSVVTRFAPSPTGYLHIGGARTALYNLLYARHRNGKFLLRIEDTDQSRHIEDAVTAIRDGLLWLGIEWDEEHRQSAARQKHQAEAERLVAEGKAYRCYTTPEEMTAIKASHPKRRAVSPFRPAAGTSASTTQAADTQTGSYVIRLITPEHGHTTLDDLVQGAVTLNNEDIDDFVLLRSDGTPTYMHAVVVDDNASGVTTIIRGDDHLVNGVKHQLLYEALGYALPEFAHIPLIHAEDGTKLSKRHGAVGIEQFQAQGYLPEAIVNWLMRMGWGYGDREMFSLADASALFAIADVGKSPARLDYAKLNSFNCHYIRERLGHDRLSLVALVRQHTADAVSDEQIDAALELITPRHQTINGIGDEIT
ncbi:MAG: glutamate--tRNA ligase, partial [Alphaproteobacteria bacterium]|nr:glutamate--tRNA ligase [Alphaproteobacteria bacterium]